MKVLKGKVVAGVGNCAFWIEQQDHYQRIQGRGRHVKSLLEPQSRRARQVFGLLALAAGLFGLAVAAWLRLANLEKGWAIPTAAALTGVYSLIIARRLLASSRSHLISPVTLVPMGAFLLFGATAPIRYGLDDTYR